MIDHYSTLGVGKNANADDIKKAYRKLAGKHHPDKGGDTATFQKIEEAYRILSDPNQRQQYDNPMQQGNPFGGFSGGAGGFNFNFNSDINDLFGQMFQQHNARRPNTPHAFRTQVHITLEQAYYGDSQNLQLRTPHGNHAITIEIPKGVNHGSQIRYENVIPQATLIVEFVIQSHLKYERRGNDLYCTQPVSVLDLIVGGEIEFTTISGKKLMVTVPPGTQPHMHLKIAREGMPIHSTLMYGDQIILIKPILPDIIDREITDSIIRAKSK